MADKEQVKIPNHVGIILDGNRRWAKERNLPSFEGHRQGADKVKKSVDWFFSRGVRVISFYAFSTENWKRTSEEVGYLMNLLGSVLKEYVNVAIEKDYRLLYSGRIDDLPGDLPQACREAMKRTANGKKGIVNTCLNYGGRAEIVDAMKKIIKNDADEGQIDEEIISKNLYQSDLPDPDVIIRTSGEKRLSGFLLWESAYSELMFLDKYWPDFEESDADMVVEEYARRNRRFGGG